MKNIRNSRLKLILFAALFLSASAFIAQTNEINSNSQKHLHPKRTLLLKKVKY